jgi:hypothetical protein
MMTALPFQLAIPKIALPAVLIAASKLFEAITRQNYSKFCSFGEI